MIITRADYMAGKADHTTYYGQYVNAWARDLVRDRIGMERLMASTDPHLNDIPLGKWDGMPATRDMARIAEEAGTWVSLGDKVCIYKEAARQLIQEETRS